MVIRSIVHDVRYSARLWRRHPARYMTTVGMLSLGLGLVAVLAAVVDAAWIRPLPFLTPDRLVEVQVRSAMPDGDVHSLSPSVEDVLALRNAGGVVAAIGGYFGLEERLVVDRGEPERLTVMSATPGYFEAHGAMPRAGRFFTDADTRTGAPEVVVVGHAYWTQRLRADPAVVGTSLVVDGRSATIIGVLPPQLHRMTHLWRPIPASSHAATGRASGLDVVARLIDGIPVATAAAMLSEEARLWSVNTRFGPVEQVELRSVYDQVIEQSRTAMTFIIVSVTGLVLVIAINVAGLVSSQGTARRQELAIRASMGAGRGRLLSQQMIEATCLGLVAAAAGAFVAWMSLDVLLAILPLELPPHAVVAVNWRVFALTLAAGVLVAWLVVAVPAWRMSSFNLKDWLTGRTPEAGRRWARRPGQAIVMAQVALAVTLLAGGGLLVRSLNRLLEVDLGFQPSGLHVLEVVPTDADVRVWRLYYPALIERLSRMPGVTSVGATDWVPLGNQPIMVMSNKPGQDWDLSAIGVTAGFADALGLRVLEGRWFETGDDDRPLTVLSASAARAVGGGQPVVGTVIDVGEHLTVIGVVGDIRGWGPRSQPDALAYTPLVPHTFSPPSMVFRVSGAAPSLPELREAAASLGTRVVVERVRPGAALLSDNVEQPRQRRALLVLLAAIGLLLALVGVGGISLSSVNRRTREIGVRMAFGATPRQVVRLITAEAAWPAAAGVAIGLTGAVYASRVLETFLFNTSPRDPVVFSVVGVTVIVVVVAVAWIPARQAARVDPVTALRAE